MSIEFRTATADDAEAIFRSDGRAFGFIWTEEQQQERIASLPFERFQLALDGAEVVAVAGAMPFDMTMPGGATVPACGVTWVGVQATHRRRGLLTELMGRVHADALSRGEPVSILHASEAVIYGRFGYGVTTLERAVRIDRARTRWRAERPAAGAARYADGPDARRRQEALWERGRRQRPGELSREPALWELIHALRSRPAGSASASFHLEHHDGYAVYRVSEKWEDGHPLSTLEVTELVALTPAAHAALWHTVLSVDLVGSVKFRALPLDDPLPTYLDNPRGVLTTGLTDGLWLLPLDVATAFAARTYGTEDRFVVEVAGRRWAIEGGPGGASVRAVRSRPDLVMDTATAGSLLLGAVRAGGLAAGGRLRATSPDVLRRADRFFLADVEPCSLTHF